MVLRNILIDLDGTLTDPKEGICGSIRYALQKMGQPVDQDVALDWCIGPPLKQSLAQLLNTQDDVLAEQALIAYRERFSVIGLYENVVYPNVEKTLIELSGKYRLFVATAKPTIYAIKILDHFGLSQYFEKIYGSELSGERTNKGDLIGYLLEQEQLNIDECIMVGDREHDILGAHRYGMPSVGALYGYGGEEEIALAKPTYTVSDFEGLLRLL